MERMTKRNSMGIAVYQKPFECERCGDLIYRLPDYGNGSPTEKLADYEDADEQGLYYDKVLNDLWRLIISKYDEGLSLEELSEEIEYLKEIKNND